ncbi:hypothetical protein RRG08_044215 [Elysia crispata]|uniref:Uncharacterized protein n=1 Tax=Elysia crispata TaxID=231223 RepID=A0AAE0XXH2_9GAST|nr:hypothetical protein RRG08_044215 [Elysia crispata]
MDHSEYLYKVQIQTQTIGWEGRGYNQVISCGASMDHSRVPIQSTDTDYWLGGSWLQPSHIMWSEHGPFQSTYTKYRYRHRLLVGRVVVTTKLYHVERAWTILEYLYRVQIQTQTIGWEGRGCNQVISRGASMDHSRVPIQSTDTDTDYWLGGSWLQPSYIMWSEHGPFQSTYTEYRYRHRLLVGGGVVVATKSYHVERVWTILEYLYRVQTQIQTIGWGVVVATKSYHVERAWTTLEYLYRVQTQTIGFFFGGEGRGCNQVISCGASMDHSRVPIQSTDTDTDYWLGGGSWLQPSHIMWSEHGPL